MMRRLLGGVLANAYGQAVAVGVQLVSVPLLLHSWGSTRLGLWLLLAAAPAALAVADCGITVTSGNAMTAAVARGDTGEAGRLLAQAVRFVAHVIALCMAAALLAAVVVPAAWLPSAAGIASHEAAVTGLAFVAITLASLGLSVLDTAFRANRDYAFGFTAVTTIRLVEALAVLAVAGAGGGLAAAALAMLGVRLGGMGVLAALVGRRVPWARLRSSSTGWTAVRPLLGPAIAAVAVPAALAVNIQGMVLVAGAVLPLAVVPAYAAARTLTRLLVQAIGLFTHALMPEIARAAGRGDPIEVRRLVHFNRLIGWGLLLPAWAGLSVLGPTLLHRWTAGQLDVHPLPFAVLTTAALCHGLWLSNANLLLATNRQGEFAYAALAVAALTCLGALMIGPSGGLLGLALASLAGEAAMVVLVLPKMARTTAFVAPLAPQPREA